MGKYQGEKSAVNYVCLDCEERDRIFWFQQRRNATPFPLQYIDSMG
ncbi:MAG: hypothetical protein WD424_02980 [Paenibacillaceae bacterium]